MRARIYKSAKSPTQSGRGNLDKWVLEFEQNPNKKRFISSVMGWTGTSDMNQELRLKFDNKEQAIAYADKNDIEYDFYEPNVRSVKPKSYSDNFK